MIGSRYSCSVSEEGLMCGVISLTGNDSILGHLTVAVKFFWMTSYLLLITLHFFTLFFFQPLAHFAKYFRHTYFANFLHANFCCRRHNNLLNVEQWAVILAYLLNRVLIFFIESFRNISVSDGSGQNFFVYLKTTFHHYKFSVLPTESIFILQGWKQISFKLHNKR